jgi:GT2 family glycosyltransferase
MFENEYQTIPAGLIGELAALPLPEVLDHHQNYLDLFLLDPTVCVVYINRLLGDKDIASNEAAINDLAYLVGKYVRLEPFEPTGLTLQVQLRNDAAARSLLQYLESIKGSIPLEQKIQKLSERGEQDAAIRMLERMLPDILGNIRLANTLLGLLRKKGRPIPPPLAAVEVPDPFALQWKRHLFTTYAALNILPEALALWEEIQHGVKDEVALNAAAEILRQSGDTAAAVRCYADSLALDPLQGPVRRRLAELRRPTVPDKSLLQANPVNIYLYSYNKAQLLEETLGSLAGCELGPARIKVLLNGCTDDSLAVAERAAAMFPDNTFQSVPLQVNVGAPAARNWLIADPQTQEAAYTVFLDDDILLQPDFLHHFLTSAATRPKCGVVGCKTVSPGQPAKYQYLYRNIAIAKRGIIRISLDTPNSQYDTGLYDFNRDTANVMGCCHMLSREALNDVPSFDLCFSPSQMDDIAHDLDLGLLGYQIVYCGLVNCVHRQMTGGRHDPTTMVRRFGNIQGNDVKFYYRFREQLQPLMQLGADSQNCPTQA